MFSKPNKKKEKAPEDWKKIKEVVDSIFTSNSKTIERMTNYLKQFEGEIWDDASMKDETDRGRFKSKAFINMVFSTIEAIAPMLTDSKPITTLIPRMPYFEKLAIRYNNGLKYLWDATDMQRAIYKAELMAMIMKKGIFKVYYDPTKQWGEDIRVDVVDPRYFFMAQGYTDIWDAPYCGVKEPKPLSWIKRRWPEAKNIKPESSSFDSEHMIDANAYSDESEFTLSAHFATVYEVWMRDDETMEEIIKEYEDPETGEKKKGKELKKKYPHGKFMYFTKSQYLGTEPCEYIHDLPPYVGLDDYMDPTKFIGIGEVDMIDGLNKELNLQLQAVMDHSRGVNNPNYIADTESGIDIEDVKAKMYEGGQVWAYDSAMTNRPPLEPVQLANIPSDVYNIIQMIPELIVELSGVTEISKGEAAKKERQSASEVAILVESSHTRTRQKVRNLEWSLKRVCYLMVKLMQQYYTEPRIIHNMDSEGNVLYQKIGNSLAQAIDIIGPDPEVIEKGMTLDDLQRKKELEPQQLDELEDYEELVESFSNNGEIDYKDPVYFDFEISIQTNSTLPMDKQSLSNLMLRLFQLKAIDNEALLDILQIPNRQEIIKRIENMKREAMQAQRGAAPPQGGK